MAKPTDKRAAECFIDSLVGWETVCEGASRAISPVVRAHLEAVLGDRMLGSGFHIPPDRAAPLAEYLRGVADLIDPPAPPVT